MNPQHTRAHFDPHVPSPQKHTCAKNNSSIRTLYTHTCAHMCTSIVMSNTHNCTEHARVRSVLASYIHITYGNRQVEADASVVCIRKLSTFTCIQAEIPPDPQAQRSRSCGKRSPAAILFSFSSQVWLSAHSSFVVSVQSFDKK